MVDVEVPFAVSALAVDAMVELFGSIEPVLKVIARVVESAVESVVSVAVRVDDPATEELTVKVTTPDEVEVPDATDTLSLPPRLETRVTVLPDTGFDCASMRVTVKVESVDPFAGTVLELATKVETLALTAPGE